MPTNQYYLQSFEIIEVTGEDRQIFLKSQFSNDISALEFNEACYATYNNHRGRAIANFIVCNTGGNVLILVKRDLIPILIQKLNLYKLRSKVNILHRNNNSYQITGHFDKTLIQSVPFPLKFSIESSNESITIPCPNGSQFIVYVKPKTQVGEIILNENDWNSFEITQGFSWITQSTSEKCVAQMFNQEWLGAVNFKKGCYPGQEIIARSQYRGQVKRRPALLFSSSDEYLIGDILYQQEQEVGLILNKAQIGQQSIYLAVIKIDSEPLFYGNKKNNLNPLELKQLFYYQETVE
ncbi:MAG: folate-binding protein [Neisseriaceae bacterium]|nr:MAG: folate-binding protein [Neisseriaceae bacterium]